MTDVQMLAGIRTTMGQPIRDAIIDSPFPETFLAALAANECSGDPAVKRFEPVPFVALCKVLAGQEPAFGAIGADDIRRILTTTLATGSPFQKIAGGLLDLATSWGPTQIMGYQVIDLAMTVSDLRALPAHFRVCVILLKQFQHEWKLDIPLQIDDPVWGEYFRCWNTGRPDGTTTDPKYSAKGMTRMAIYAGLP